MSKLYSRINWQNTPSTDTPINADNLNIMDKGLDALDDKVVELDEGKVDKVTGKGLSTNDYTTAEKTKLNGIEAGAEANTITGIKGNAESTYRTGNVNITPANIGLGNVNNTSDANKPVSTAQQKALDLKANATDLTSHTGNTSNPHSVTKAQVGLGNVENKSSATIRSEITSSNVTTALGYTPLNSTLKGATSGVAELDANGKVPTSQLPSYVDDVLESSSMGNFPATGEAGKIYVALNTNKTYRWSGSAYVEISPSLALGETSSTAYRGDRGKVAYTHSQVTSGNPHKVTASDVGLGNVPNVTTNNQTPTYTIASSNTALSSGETMTTAFGKIAKAVSSLISHLSNKSNPHAVTKTQVGLGNCDNTSDANKPISNATQTALNSRRAFKTIFVDDYDQHQGQYIYIKVKATQYEFSGKTYTFLKDIIKWDMVQWASDNKDDDEYEYHYCGVVGKSDCGLGYYNLTVPKEQGESGIFDGDAKYITDVTSYYNADESCVEIELSVDSSHGKFTLMFEYDPTMTTITDDIVNNGQ